MAKSCLICGSKRWRKDKVTGSAVCEEGHVRQDYRSETLVMDQGGQGFHMTRRRTGTKGTRRNTRREEGRANPEYYHGDEAEYLRIHALQLLLRLQVQAISKLWSLPDTFEMIIRDLWAYQLAVSSLPSMPDPSRGSSSPSPPPPTQPSQNPGLLDVEMADGGRSDRSSEDGEGEEKHDSSDDQSEAETELELDPDILERLEGSDEEEEGSDQEGTRGQKGDVGPRRKRRLRVSDTIVTLVMGLWVLRVPVIGSDIEDLINEMKIPYIDFGHTTYISHDMRRHMNRDVMIALSPLRSPSPVIIHRSCRLFARMLSKRFGMQVPEVNIHPIAWRMVSSLGGTPTTYMQTIRLMAVLDLNLSLLHREVGTLTRRARSRTKLKEMSDGSDSEDVADRKMESYEKAINYLDVVAPEVAVVAAWIVVMKMMYGLDGVPREALLKSDPVIGLPNGVSWVNELRTRLENGTLRYKRKELEQHDFIKMDDDDLDAFLAKSQQVLLQHRPEPSDVSPFPLPAPVAVPAPLIAPNSWHVHHSTVPAIAHSPVMPTKGKEDNKTLPLMPGEKVRQYGWDEMDLPGDLETVLNAGCELVHWDAQDVLKVVEHFERRLGRLRPRHDYKGVKDEDEDEADMDDRPRKLTRSKSSTAIGVGSRSRPGSREASLSRSRPGSRAGSRSRTARESLGRTASHSNLTRTGSGSRLRSG